MQTHVTPAPWSLRLQHPWYGTAETYRMAAEWLKDCPTVADWGGGSGFLSTMLPSTTRYTVIDGTDQPCGGNRHVLADLTTFTEPSAGILLRHVLELNTDWRAILQNALLAFTQRLVLITFTGDVAETTLLKMKSGWPVHAFNPEDLRQVMGELLVAERTLQTSHPEHVFFLARGGHR